MRPVSEILEELKLKNPKDELVLELEDAIMDEEDMGLEEEDGLDMPEMEEEAPEGAADFDSLLSEDLGEEDELADEDIDAELKDEEDEEEEDEL